MPRGGARGLGVYVCHPGGGTPKTRECATRVGAQVPRSAWAWWMCVCAARVVVYPNLWSNLARLGGGGDVGLRMRATSSSSSPFECCHDKVVVGLRPVGVPLGCGGTRVGRNASHNPFRPCQHPFPTPASSNILCREANLLQHPLPRGEPPPTSFLESRASSNILAFLSSLLVKLHANLIYSSRDRKRNAIVYTRTRITWIHCPALCQPGQAHWFGIRMSSRYTCLT